GDVLGAGERVGAVDVHGARPAHSFAAGPPEGQGRIHLVLDLDKSVQDHRSAGVEVDLVAVDARIAAGIRVPAVDLEGAGAASAAGSRKHLALDRAVLRGEHQFSHANLNTPASSVNPRLGREALYVVAERLQVDGAIVELHLAVLASPGDRVLEPLL